MLAQTAGPGKQKQAVDLEFYLSVFEVWEQAKHYGDYGGEVCVTCVDDPQLASGFL